MTGPIQPLRAFVDAELAAALEDEITSPEQIDAEMAAGKPAQQEPFEVNRIAFLMDRGMAIACGYVEPTEQERAETAAWVAQHAREVAQEWSVYDTATSALDAIQEPTARAVLDLHHPDEQSGRIACQGCDFSGYDSEAPAWPCRTVQAVAKPHGVTLPDPDLLDLHYDRETGAYVRPGEGQ